ncbi:hypothetical protein FS749_004086 [Ceratobasidium sp. UAMH 11750]|nr:hypothetical protein FS749_004086 [Ceratobasidium sp. UAMH 11750]
MVGAGRCAGRTAWLALGSRSLRCGTQRIERRAIGFCLGNSMLVVQQVGTEVCTCSIQLDVNLRPIAWSPEVLHP